ncbi:hypothetical protein CL634_10395, partial [bacterium]|nr:hypothetical protein [bacterium]
MTKKQLSVKVYRMKRILLIFGLALALALPVAALAGSPFVTGDTIIVAEEDIIDGNYLVSGNSINIDGNVNGDVIFAGSNVVINGDVAGDVIGAGASIRITGEVEGSVRVAGSNIQIDGQVGHNVIAFGGNVVISDSAEIGWELFTGAGNVEVRGEIGTNVTGAAGNMLISGSVGRDLNVAGDTISILPDASIDGDVTYRTENAESLIVSEGATISGEITHDTLDKHFDGNK